MRCMRTHSIAFTRCTLYTQIHPPIPHSLRQNIVFGTKNCLLLLFSLILETQSLVWNQTGTAVMTISLDDNKHDYISFKAFHSISL
jgi:hypothetical protein